MLLSATDLELGIRSAVTQVEVEKPGETLVIADTLARIVRECPDEILIAETDESALNIRGVGSHSVSSPRPPLSSRRWRSSKEMRTSSWSKSRWGG